RERSREHAVAQVAGRRRRHGRAVAEHRERDALEAREVLGPHAVAVGAALERRELRGTPRLRALAGGDRRDADDLVLALELEPQFDRRHYDAVALELDRPGRRLVELRFEFKGEDEIV